MDRGFTIIEVLLFFSISGVIVLMVLTGFNSSLEANRRVDSNRSFEAAIEAEYTSVRTGTVVREVNAGLVPRCTGGPPSTSGTYPGASDDCLVIGKLLKIKQGLDSKITSHNIIANINPTSTCTFTGVQAIIRCHDARVLDISKIAGSITPQWSTQISRVDFQSKSGTSYKPYDSSQLAYIAMLRDPSSELVYIVPLRLPSQTAGLQSLTNPADTQVADFENTKGQICLTHDGLLLPKSYLRFTGGEGIGTIDITTEPLLTTGVPAC